ncbi:hypothetical protein ACP70R_043157 [Stipagrostis hirtigluma subsp. patula]
MLGALLPLPRLSGRTALPPPLRPSVLDIGEAVAPSSIRHFAGQQARGCAELEEEKRRRQVLEAQMQVMRSEQHAREVEQRAREHQFYLYMQSPFAALGHTLPSMPPFVPPQPSAISPESPLTTLQLHCN